MPATRRCSLAGLQQWHRTSATTERSLGSVYAHRISSSIVVSSEGTSSFGHFVSSRTPQPRLVASYMGHAALRSSHVAPASFAMAPALTPSSMVLVAICAPANRSAIVSKNAAPLQPIAHASTTACGIAYASTTACAVCDMRTKAPLVFSVPQPRLLRPVLGVQQLLCVHHLPHGDVRSKVGAQPPERQVAVLCERRKDQLPAEPLNETWVSLCVRSVQSW